MCSLTINAVSGECQTVSVILAGFEEVLEEVWESAFLTQETKQSIARYEIMETTKTFLITLNYNNGKEL